MLRVRVGKEVVGAEDVLEAVVGLRLGGLRLGLCERRRRVVRLIGKTGGSGYWSVLIRYSAFRMTSADLVAYPVR